MNLVLMLGIKALVGGAAVVAFAAVGQVVRPRGLGGIFAAAPSVAIASLAITAIVSGAGPAAAQATGMVEGAVALFVACLVGIEAVKRFGALRGALGLVGVWFTVALTLGALTLR